MKKTLHALALASLVVSSAGCGSAEENIAPTEPGILDEYVKDAPESKTPTETQTTPEETTAPSTKESGYKDGTYTAGGEYQSPAGKETMQVSITLKDGLVSAVTLTPAATDPTSLQIQQMVAGELPKLVVGKSLDAIGGYATINGASLTPKGFDVALAQIRTLAQ